MSNDGDLLEGFLDSDFYLYLNSEDALVPASFVLKLRSFPVVSHR